MLIKGQAKIKRKPTCVRFDSQLLKLVDAECRRLGVTRLHFIEHCLSLYFDALKDDENILGQ